MKIAFLMLMVIAMLAVGGPMFAAPKSNKNSTYQVTTGKGTQSLGGRGQAKGLERAAERSPAISLSKPGGKG